MSEMKFAAFLVLLLPLFLTGCSRMDVAYSFAPRIAANQLEDAFDLSSKRYHKIKETIEKDLKANKGEIKSGLIGMIDSFTLVADNKKLTQDEIRAFFNTGKDLQVRYISLLKPSFEEVLGSMSRNELENLKTYSDKKFEKNEEKLADVEKFKRTSLEQFEKHMDTFFDSVTDEQRRLYGAFLAENLDYYKYQLSVRRNFVAKFDSLFETKPELIDYVVKYYSGDSNVKAEEYRKKQELYFQNAFAVAESIWQTLTDRQRTEFKKTLADMRSDLSSL